MSRHSRTDAALCIPRMVPWRDWDEWYRVKALLFSPEPYLRSQGVQHVAVWQCREHIPHAVETTSQLVEVRLNDVGAAGGGLVMSGARRGEEELRLIYSSVVVRAVNGLTGHEQKSVRAAPVSCLAREIGLPTWLVDIRHEAAHKQLPGIVTLRLAADFLVDYVWRRYWGPQAEHLGFVWGAFDRLFSRYKATSENGNTPLPPNPSPGNAGQRVRRAASPAQSARKRRRTGAPDPDGDSDSPAPLDDGASTGGLAGERSGSKTPRSGSRENTGAPGPSASSHSKPPAADGDSADFALEVAAREIARSATPTALSWALLSLLADGGVGAGSGADGFAGPARRGQGHLLPRSRDKYPTPGTPGVDAREVGRRVTARWATLLNLFHVQWRGFGAALLVRLVEALLANAASPLPLPPPPPTAAAAAAAAHPRGAGSGSGSGGGLERQAAFIEVWVRHLLSRRWHLRSNDPRIRSALREAAADAGLSPAFCGEQEGSWEEEESTWADEPAPLPVLHAALFPVRELLERCRRLLETLPLAAAPELVQPPPTAAPSALALGDDGVGTAGENNTSAPPATPADDASVNHGHWARAGLESVCHALAEVLPGEGAASASCDSAAAGTTRGDGDTNRGDGDRAAAGAGAVGDRSPASARQEVGSLASGGPLGGDDDRRAPGPSATPMNCEVVDGGGGGGGGGGRADEGIVSGGDGQDNGGGGDGAGNFKSAGSTNATAAGVPGAAPSSAAMIDLDDLERLLGAEGSSPRCLVPVVPRGVDGRCPLASAEAVDNAAAGVVGAEWGAGLRKAVQTEVLRDSRAPAADGNGGAWELVTSWTPCAIGTLPGWSAVRL